MCVCVAAVPEMDPPIDTNLIEFDTKYVPEDSFFFVFVNKVLTACEWNIFLSVNFDLEGPNGHAAL